MSLSVSVCYNEFIGDLLSAVAVVVRELLSVVGGGGGGGGAEAEITVQSN